MKKKIFIFILIISLYCVYADTSLVTNFIPENNSIPTEFPIQMSVANLGSSIIEIFASNDSSTLSYENALVYKNHDTTSETNLRYNFTNLPLTSNDETVLLIHFDNVSDYNENGTLMYDFSPNNLTINSSVKYCQGKWGYGINVTNNDYVSISYNEKLNLSSYNQFTISIWLYWYGNNTKNNALFSQGFYYTTPTYGAWIYSTGHYNLATGGLSDTGRASVNSYDTVTPYQWTMLTFTWNGTYKSIYKNGGFIIGEAGTGKLASDQETLYIGYHGSSGQQFNGIIDEFIIYNRSLSANEILDIFSQRQTIYWKVKTDNGESNVSNFYNKFLYCDGGLPACQSYTDNGGHIALINDISQQSETLNINKNNTNINCNNHILATSLNISNQSAIIQNCNILKTDYSIIQFQSRSHNSVFKNNIFNLSRYGLDIYSDNLTIYNNTFISNSQGSIKVYANFTNISNNFFSYGQQPEIQIDSGSNNITINNNIFNNTYSGIQNYGNITEYLNNKLTNNYNGTMIYLGDNRTNYDLGSNIYFNLTLKHPNGIICPTCQYNITTYPSSLNGYKLYQNNENLSISFNANNNGIYYFKINVSDEYENYEDKKIMFSVNLTPKKERRYLRSTEPSTYYQFASNAWDTGLMTIETPTSEETRHCEAWVQFVLQNKLGYFPAFINKINISTWYSSTGSIYLGFNLMDDFGGNKDYQGNLMDYGELLPSTSGSYNWTSVEFSDLHITYDNLWSQYFLGIQLVQTGTLPKILTNSTRWSYTDFTYLIPTINITTFEGNAEILSFIYSPDEKSVNITFDGYNNLNLTLQMPINLSNNGGYLAYLDDILCNQTSSTCNFTNTLSTDLNFSLVLGSEHILRILPNITVTVAATQETNQASNTAITTTSGNQVSAHAIINSDLQKGLIQYLSQNDKISFNLENKIHELKINYITNESVSITVSSEPITLKLKINESKKINLNNDNYYDLSIYLRNILKSSENLEAVLIIKEINETIKIIDEKLPKTTESQETKLIEENIPNKYGYIIYLLIGSIILVMMFIFYEAITF